MQIPPAPEFSPTVQAIYDHYAAKYNAEPARPYLGGSIIGTECERALWYTFRWATKKEFSGRLLRLFQRGHREEPWLVDDLRAVGITVWDINPATKKQWSFSEPDTGHHLAGNADGILQGVLEAPVAPHLWECKTHATKSFVDVKGKGVLVSKPMHHAQMQIYMHWTQAQFGKTNGCKRALYTAVCKDTDEIYSERIEYDEEFSLGLIGKAKRIITAKTPLPRMTDDPTWYVCKFCDHHAVCHTDKVPLVNCRTCTHSNAELNGDARWSCNRFTDAPKDISIRDQRTGCPDHCFNPYLLTQWAEPIDASADDNWVKYRIKATGKDFINGVPPEGHTSAEIAAAADKNALTDPAIQAYRHGEFDARIVG
jgi:hypothetical protein